MGDGSITGPKTHTSRSGDERARWSGIGISRPCRNLLQLTPPFTIVSTRTVTSTADIYSSRAARPLWQSGANLRPGIYGLQGFSEQFSFALQCCDRTWGRRRMRYPAQGCWDDMAALISDDVVDLFATVGTRYTIGDQLEKRYGGLADSLSLFPPNDTDPGPLGEII